jgi:deglycase
MLRDQADDTGGRCVNQQVRVDLGVVATRKPDDLPPFCAKLGEEFAEGRHDRAAAATAGASRSA